MHWFTALTIKTSPAKGSEETKARFLEVKQKEFVCGAVGGWFLLGWFMRGPKITINNREIFSAAEVCLQQRSFLFCSGTTENEIMNHNNALLFL